MRTTASLIVTMFFGIKKPAGNAGGAVVFALSRWCSTGRGAHSAVTSVTAARALDSLTMGLV
jgi:hypothetical protein